MIKFCFSTQDIACRNHNIGIVGIFVHAVTKFNVDKSDALTTNDTGPMADPCIMLAVML